MVDSAEGHEGGDDAQGSGGPSRRDVLKGGGAAAAMGMMLKNQGSVVEGRAGGDVPSDSEADGDVRSFEVHAIEVDLVYNRYGLHQPNAAIYVLKENLEEARKASGKIPCGNTVVQEDAPFCDHGTHGRGKQDDHEENGGNNDSHQGDEKQDDDHNHEKQKQHTHRQTGNRKRGGGDDGDDGADGKQGGDHRDDGNGHEHPEHAHDVNTRVLQPLTLRANKGDIIEIEFHNDLSDRTASIHQTSLPYEVESNDGMDVGFNPDTTVPPGESITYRWHADDLGTHFFLDGANQAVDSADEPPEQANLTARGLFGSIQVYPDGTSWSDPFTGTSLQGYVQADIHVPDGISQDAMEEGYVPGLSFRDLKLYYHSPPGVYTQDGDQLMWPDSDEPQSTHAINYRADPTGNRIDEDRCGACDSSEFYSSWIHGDPGGGDNVYPMYLGDPFRATAIGASIEENHVHHLHGHRWKEISPLGSSDTIDAQTVGIGATYETPIVPAFDEPQGTIDNFETVRPDMEFEDAFEVGAGGAHGSTGDFLFHCHLFPHYAEGMWGIVRVLDKVHEGLEKLPTNEPPLSADSDISGYPEFIPGEFGTAPPFPPYGAAGLEGYRDPTEEEREALTREGEILPGAPYTDPCEPEFDVHSHDGPTEAFDGETREYTIVALPADIVYNDDGHHDPDGIVYALEEDADKIREGKMNPEPLVIRANVGDCIEVTLKNEVERDVQSVPVAGDGPDKGGGKSNHIHFVSYDVLGSDSLATGFNYNQQSLPDRPLPSRWYADEEGTIFFHDHITGIENVMNGSFCALIVEPRGSEWLDPYSGEPIRSGTQAIIKNPNGDDYREYGIALQDFAQLVDRDGDFVNPDREHNENAGVMAVNYRNAPYYTREDGDPAYVHSSFVHGDPATPLLEAYADDPIRFRVWQPSYEEMHNFNLHGRELDVVGLDPSEAVSPIIGTSEAFTFEVVPDAEDEGLPGDELQENPAGIPVRDYAYGSTVVDDLWDGMWGIHRVFGAEVEHLEPLPDRGSPSGSISNEDLREMGHPVVFSDFDWTKYGQVAQLLYADHDDREFPADKDARQNDSIDGDPPPKAPGPGEPCPTDPPDKKFAVSAIQQQINYNDYGDQDPHGVVFALDSHVEELRKQSRPFTPLSLWVEAGDCVEVTLTNLLDPDELDNEHAHPQMRTKEENLGIDWDRSERISLHPTRAAYNVLGSDGATFGFNWDQTIGPGETITYRWYVEEDVGAFALWDHADIRSNRHHGAYGQVLIGEEGTRFADPRTAEPLVQGLSTSAIAKKPGKKRDQRHYALAFADAQHIVNPTTDTCVVPPGPEAEEDGDEDEDDPCNQITDDTEDQGYPGINYRSEPFIRRFDDDPDPPKVYDSETHGDPATPIPRALVNDPVVFKTNKVADKARGLSFHLSDHQWNNFRGVPESDDVGVEDRYTVGKSDRVEPQGGAGGLADTTGDFIYQELKMVRRLEGGFWGIFRVRDSLTAFEDPLQPLPDRAKRKGVRPEHHPGWRIATGDLTGDGNTDLMVGVPASDVAGRRAGAVYLFYGPVDAKGITDLLDVDAQLLGTSPGEQVGSDVGISNNRGIVDRPDADTSYVFDGTQRVTGSKSLADVETKSRPPDESE